MLRSHLCALTLTMFLESFYWFKYSFLHVRTSEIRSIKLSLKAIDMNENENKTVPSFMIKLSFPLLFSFIWLWVFLRFHFDVFLFLSSFKKNRWSLTTIFILSFEIEFVSSLCFVKNEDLEKTVKWFREAFMRFPVVAVKQ